MESPLIKDFTSLRNLEFEKLRDKTWHHSFVDLGQRGSIFLEGKKTPFET